MPSMAETMIDTIESIAVFLALKYTFVYAVLLEDVISKKRINYLFRHSTNVGKSPPENYEHLPSTTSDGRCRAVKSGISSPKHDHIPK